MERRARWRFAANAPSGTTVGGPRPPRASVTALALVAWLAGAGAAHAADGVIEINDVRAQAGGVTPGDAPGYPVSLTVPGSYRLTGNLIVNDANTSVISVTAARVSIDLAGFAIVGPVRCTGTPIACAPSGGTGRGIDSINALQSDTHVHDGSVVGMGNFGVHLSGLNARVENVRALQNGGRGIDVAAGSTVTGCVVAKNGGYGVSLGDGAIARENVSDENVFGGVIVEDHGVVERNALYENSFRGLFSGGVGVTVRQNALRGNLLDGMRIIGSGALVVDNAAIGNASAGIDCATGCAVLGNLAVGNHIGLTLGADSAYRRNTLMGNETGLSPLPVSGTGVERGNNFCSGTGTIAATCP